MVSKLLVSAALGALATMSQGSDLVIPFDSQPANTFAMYSLGGECSNGEDAYFGFIQGPNNDQQDKIFLEIMGGTVCFNKTSCEDSDLSAWMGTANFLSEQLRLDENTMRVVKSGAPLPMSMVSSLKPGWMPGSSAHPLFGRAGIYLPTCTADFMLGRHTLTYEDGSEVKHHGGKNLDRLLAAVQRQRPTITDFALYGGSGGGVTASMWMSRVADVWPMATVSTFVDSGFLMTPGDGFAEFLYNTVPWSPGPGGDNAGKLQGVTLPSWNWLQRDAIVRDLIAYNGRLRIAYLACDKHSTASSSARDNMMGYAGITVDELEMWDFLTNLKKCAPSGTAFTYINDCSIHHLSRVGFPTGGNIDDEITSKSFSTDFLAGTDVDTDNPEKRHFWSESHDAEADGGVCPPTPAPTPAPPTPAPPAPVPTPAPTLAPAPARSEESSGSSTAHLWLAVLAVLMTWSQ